jgi:hypothetical protein
MCVHTAKDIWSLCRVHTHGKGATCRPTVLLGAPGGRARMVLCRAWQSKAARQSVARQTLLRTATQGARQRSRAHGKATAHGSDGDARQRSLARQRPQRTAEMATHGKGRCRAIRPCARQRQLCRRRLCRANYAVRARTAKPLPCV